jgi:hypothetical protein
MKAPPNVAVEGTSWNIVALRGEVRGRRRAPLH